MKDSEQSSSHPKARLKPWLLQRLNDQSIPGVFWVDKAKCIFRIPWVHQGNQTWNEEDALLLKDWALVTGKFNEKTDKPNWPQWKTRLRCAINKSTEIQEIRHNEMNFNIPCKTFRFVSSNESMWTSNIAKHACMMFGEPSLTARPDDEFNFALANGLIPEGHESNIINKLNRQSYRYIEEGLIKSPPELYQIACRLMHLDQRLRDSIVTNPVGCCIYTTSLDRQLASNLDQIEIPLRLDDEDSFHGVVDVQNKEYVELLLHNLDKGILLMTNSQGDIIAERLCKCAAFVYESAVNEAELETSCNIPSLICKLDRKARKKIFDYKQFCTDLELYTNGLISTPPQSEVIISLGQQLTEDCLPNEYFLIWARVASCAAWWQLRKWQIQSTSPAEKKMSFTLKSPLTTSIVSYNNRNEEFDDVDLDYFLAEAQAQESLEKTKRQQVWIHQKLMPTMTSPTRVLSPPLPMMNNEKLPATRKRTVEVMSFDNGRAPTVPIKLVPRISSSGVAGKSPPNKRSLILDSIEPKTSNLGFASDKLNMVDPSNEPMLCSNSNRNFECDA